MEFFHSSFPIFFLFSTDTFTLDRDVGRLGTIYIQMSQDDGAATWYLKKVGIWPASKFKSKSYKTQDLSVWNTYLETHPLLEGGRRLIFIFGLEAFSKGEIQLLNLYFPQQDFKLIVYSFISKISEGRYKSKYVLNL